MRLVSAALLSLVALAAQAQFTPGTKVGVFPGRLPGDIATPPAPPSGLASPWQQSVIGSGTGGAATSSGNTLTDTCKGLMGFTADTGNFVYQPVSGDFEMVGQIQSIVADSVWARYVPTVRQSTATGSKYAALFFDHRGNFAFNWRDTLDAHNDWVGFDTAYSAPQYWRITRNGTSWAGYIGPTSTGPWTLNGSHAITMSDPVDAGVMCDNGGDANFSVETSSLPTINSLAGGAGTLQLTTSAVTVNEDVGTQLVSVSRVGGTSGAVGVNVARDGTSTATLTTDYTTSCTFPCTLSWSNGDGATKNITLTIVNRSGSQSSRHLDLSLATATGGASIGSPSAEVVTINDVSAGALTRHRPGYYIDCYTRMPHGGDFQHFIGSAEYTAARECMDRAAAQPPVKGVFIPVFWSAMEGDTAGSFDGSVGNALAPAGKIGFPLFDDMLAYAASKHITIIFELDWFNYFSQPCQSGPPSVPPGTDGALYASVPGYLPRYLLPPSCNGTDSANTYHGAITPWPDQYTFYLKLWDSVVMSRFMALVNAYAARYDNNIALEGWVLVGQEADAPITAGVDGFSIAGLDSQVQRIVSEVKPNWPHTNIWIATAWDNHVQAIVEEAATSATKAVSIWSNDLIIQRSDYGQAAYLGVVDNNVSPNLGTHNFQGELDYGVWNGNPREMCPPPFPGSYGDTSVTQQYDGLMTNGFVGTAPKTLKASHWVMGNEAVAGAYCPENTKNNWGTIGGTGVYNFIQTHTINTVCPSKWVGCSSTMP